MLFFAVYGVSSTADIVAPPDSEVSPLITCVTTIPGFADVVPPVIFAFPSTVLTISAVFPLFMKVKLVIPLVASICDPFKP